MAANPQAVFQEQGVPPDLQEYFNRIYHRAEELANTQQPKYQGQRVASTPDQVRRANELANRTGQAMPFYQEAADIARRSQQPFYQGYQQYMNPYMQSVVNRIAEEGNRNLTERVLPALQDQFVAAGQQGSSRHRKFATKAARDIQGEISNRQSQALSSGFQQAGQLFSADMARQLEAAKQLAQSGALAQGSNIADIASLMDQGRYAQQQQQAVQDVLYEDYVRQRENPWVQLGNQAAIAKGIPNPIQQTQFSTVPQSAQTSVLGSVGNLAASILGASLMGGRR